MKNQIFMLIAVFALTACGQKSDSSSSEGTAGHGSNSKIAAGTYKPNLSGDGITGDPTYLVNNVNSGNMPAECNGVAGIGETFTLDGQHGLTNSLGDKSYIVDGNFVTFWPSGVNFTITGDSYSLYLTFAPGCVAEYQVVQ